MLQNVHLKSDPNPFTVILDDNPVIITFKPVLLKCNNYGHMQPQAIFMTNK